MENQCQTFKELLEFLNYSFPEEKMSFDVFEDKVMCIEKVYKKLCSNSNNSNNNEEEFFKKFFGEIKPLYILSKYIGCEAIQLTSKSEKFDAIVFFSENKQRIEFTSTLDGQQREKQLEHSTKYPRTPIWEPIKTNDKTKASGKKEILYTKSPLKEVDDMKDDMEIDLKDKLKDRMERKLKKDNAMYNGAWLVVVFTMDDYPYSSNNDLIRVFNDIKTDCEIKFNRIYFLGQNFGKKNTIKEDSKHLLNSTHKCNFD